MCFRLEVEQFSHFLTPPFSLLNSYHLSPENTEMERTSGSSFLRQDVKKQILEQILQLREEWNSLKMFEMCLKLVWSLSNRKWNDC